MAWVGCLSPMRIRRLRLFALLLSQVDLEQNLCYFRVGRRLVAIPIWSTWLQHHANWKSPAGQNCIATWPCEFWYVKSKLAISSWNWFISVGWDPIFEYDGRTYAEMDKEDKVELINLLSSNFSMAADLNCSEQCLPSLQGFTKIEAMATSWDKFLIVLSKQRNF